MSCEYRKKSMQNNKGVALIVTFMLMVSLIIIVAAYLFLVTVGIRTANAQVQSVQSLYLSEAGLNKAIWYLLNTAPDGSTDGSWRTASYPTDAGSGGTDSKQESLGSGTYTLWVETLGSNVLVTSKGESNGLERIVQQEVTISTGVPEAFSYVSHSGTNTTFKNTKNTTVTGNLSVGNKFTNGKSVDINGTTTIKSTVAMPIVDIGAYAVIADNVVTGNKTFKKNTTFNGIWYVTGKVTIQDGVTINGSIIAIKDIKLENSEDITISSSRAYPALVSNGSIKGQALEDSSISGLIFAKKSIIFNDSDENEFDGTMIAKDITIQNSEDIDIAYDSSIYSNPPPYFSGAGAPVVESVADSWKEL